MRSVDLNCDCGEGFGAYRIGDDAAMLDIVTSVNVACGFHAGDPEIMAQTFAAAKTRGIAIGAHPGFPDLWGFGRRRLPFTTGEIERLVAYQIGAAQALCAYAGARLGYVKIHGALSNIAVEDATIAEAIARAVKTVARDLMFLVPAGTKLEEAGVTQGLAVAREIFADRAYTDAGSLVERSCAGAVLHNVTEVASRALAMISEGAIITESGKRLAAGIDSICVHGDSPNAVAMAKTIRARLEDAGIALAPFARTK
ncbi:LamB/YcsF family protein [Methylocapsa sp. D3K7]|uniref:LamB/YcsF family protein n=1 Tax=Methylocapsa sp. D3K7 TaxID=3041435 RepID=UPI00244E896B|nr:5-oxoprolinase subunit PxpA [Methylocapsa sp. D3K7]WGJ13668.1 LamB/YcsF family protein [Methylocapsa sp. D3K7]